MKSRSAGLELLGQALAELASYSVNGRVQGSAPRLQPERDHLEIRIRAPIDEGIVAARHSCPLCESAWCH
jgi:hypothetical protein